MDTVNDTSHNFSNSHCTKMHSAENEQSRPVLISRSVVQSLAFVTLQEQQSVTGQCYKWNLQTPEIPKDNKQTQTSYILRNKMYTSNLEFMLPCKKINQSHQL